MLRRCQESDREELNYWRRRSSEQEDPRKGGSAVTPFSKTHSPHSEPGGCSGDMFTPIIIKLLLFVTFEINSVIEKNYYLIMDFLCIISKHLP